MTRNCERVESQGRPDDEPDADGVGDVLPTHRRRSGQIAAAALAIILAVTVAAVAVTVRRPHSDSSAELVYTIPAGTGDRIDRGEPVQIVPADLSVKVGNVLMLDNQDTRAHLIGPFSVRAGETVRFPFTRAGLYRGYCSVHANGQVVISVVDD